MLALPIVESHNKCAQEDTGSEEDDSAPRLYLDLSQDDQNMVEIAERRATGKWGGKKVLPLHT